MLIGIKSPNTKQCPSGLSPPLVKLSSSLVGGKFMIVAYLCLYKSKELYDL